MHGKQCAFLGDRAVIALKGDDSRKFLQDLVTNDVDLVSPERAIYAALLTPQGKYLFDFFIIEHDGEFLLDCEAARAEALIKRLTMYRLRAKVEIEDARDRFQVVTAFGSEALETLDLAAEVGAARKFGDGVVFTDPRSVRAGARILWLLKTTMAALESDQFLSVYAHDYDEYRLSLGLPDGSRDFEVDRTIVLEANFEALNGIDFQKGCFVGQEVTARTKYRGLVKKRLVAVSIDGSLPAPDTPILLGDKEVGRMRSGADGLGIAMLRLEAIDPTSGPLHAGDARIVPAIDDRT